MTCLLMKSIGKLIFMWASFFQEEDGKSEITKLTLSEIKEKLNKGELKAADVLKAFQKKVIKLMIVNLGLRR